MSDPIRPEEIAPAASQPEASAAPAHRRDLLRAIAAAALAGSLSEEAAAQMPMARPRSSRG